MLPLVKIDVLRDPDTFTVVRILVLCICITYADAFVVRFQNTGFVYLHATTPVSLFPPCKAVLHYPRKITGKLIDQAETPAPADRRCDPVLFLGRGTGKETMALFSYFQNSKIL